MGPNMPVSCENSESAISSTIRDSLGNYNSQNYNSVTKGTNLGLTKTQLSTALKQSLLKTIEYVESPPGFGYTIQESLKAKYTVLRPLGPLDEEKSTAQSGKFCTKKISKENCAIPSSSFVTSSCFIDGENNFGLYTDKKSDVKL